MNWRIGGFVFLMSRTGYFLDKFVYLHYKNINKQTQFLEKVSGFVDSRLVVWFDEQGMKLVLIIQK